MLMKKFGLYATAAGSMGGRKQSNMGSLYSAKALFGSERRMPGLGPPEAEMAVTGFPTWVRRVWIRAERGCGGNSDF